MKNKKELEKMEADLDNKIMYMKKVLSESDKPEELKQIARETIIKLNEEKQKIIKEIINTKDEN